MRRFTLDQALDSDPPQPGDLLAGPASVYRIHDVRPVDSRIWPERWKLDVERLDDGTLAHRHQLLRTGAARGDRLHAFTNYRPGERPADYFNTDDDTTPQHPPHIPPPT